MIFPKLARLQSYMGVDFRNKARLMGISLRHKGLFMPEPKRTYGGAKIQQVFLMSENDENDIAATIDFSDIVQNSVIVKIKKHLKLFDQNGDVYCEKIEYELVRNEDKLKRSRYDAAYTHLKSTARGTPIEPFVNAILNHYAQETSLWLLGNPQPLIDGINNETNQTILAYLAIEFPEDVINGITKTTKDSILEQVTGIQWNPQ